MSDMVGRDAVDNTGWKIDKNRRLHGSSVIRAESNDATRKENSWNINSGLQTLTTAGESGIFYFKNNEDVNFIINAVVVILGPSTGGSATDTTHVRFYKNPTTGTLISDATAANIESNRDFGSSATLTGDSYSGTEGKTITDGSVHIESLVSPGSRVAFNIDEVLRKGNSIAISYEPNDSNTVMKCMCAIIGHLEDENNN